MTPKEKSQELLNKFLQSINYINDEGKAIIHQEPYTSSKQCALICVEEILNNFGLECNGKHYCDYATIQYYERVKTEIEAL